MRYKSFDKKIDKTWKKRLIVGGSLIFALGLVGCGAGAYGLYSLGKNMTAHIEVGSLGAAISKAGQASPESITNTVLNLASTWAAESIALGEIQSVKHGLRCVDALGGPDAGRLLETLAKHSKNLEITKIMRKVSSELTEGQASHPSSCIAFIAG